MNALLLGLALLLPPLLAPAIVSPRLRASALVLAPLPLLLLAMIGDGTLALPRLLFGMTFAVDVVNRPLLLLAGIGWALAGAVAGTRVRDGGARFAGFWLATLAGQALALLAADLAGFYAGYLLMTLAAYGLVIHAGSAEAWRAGRVYLVLALAGEAMVLAAVLVLAGGHGNAGFAALSAAGVGPVAWLLLAGFAVKLGIVPVHVWLPLAHPVAPVPASAVLSGILVKAGLLGLLRLLPEGALTAPVALFALGLATSAYGAIAGLGQARLKTVLAYSTISQMGLVLAAFAALQAAGPALALPALGLLVLHHGLNKIALFLAAGGEVGASRWRGLLFALPALSLVGLPLLAGALAKEALKSALAAAGWSAAAPILLGVASLLTGLLLLHAWRLARAERPPAGATPQPLHPAWPLAVLAGLIVPWAWALHTGIALRPWSGWFDALWPAALALALSPLLRRLRWSLPEGDLLSPVQRAVDALRRPVTGLLDAWLAMRLRLPPLWPDAARLARIEQSLLRLPVAGGLLLLVLLALALL